MTLHITDQEIKQWNMWINQIKNGYHISEDDWKEITRLNHLVMEASQDIHNNNMVRSK